MDGRLYLSRFIGCRSWKEPWRSSHSSLTDAETEALRLPKATWILTGKAGLQTQVS